MTRVLVIVGTGIVALGVYYWLQLSRTTDLTTVVADQQLLAAMRDELDIPNSGIVRESVISRVQELDIRGRGILNLKGIEVFANSLRTLVADNNSISRLDALSQCTKLQVLSLENNLVAEMSPIAQLRSLVVLSLARNPLKEISPVSHMGALESIDLSECPITDVSPLAFCNRLQVLILKGCPVADVTPLAHLEDLQHIDLRGADVVDGNLLGRLPKLKLFLRDQ